MGLLMKTLGSFVDYAKQLSMNEKLMRNFHSKVFYLKWIFNGLYFKMKRGKIKHFLFLPPPHQNYITATFPEAISKEVIMNMKIEERINKQLALIP